MYVTVGIGLTLRISKESQYEFIRPSVEIGQIDPEEDVQSQLETAVKALRQTWDKTTHETNELILAEMKQVDAEMQNQIAKRFKDMNVVVNSLREDIKALQERVDS
jgi:biotin-(acetyl-CoA carboxylase) ligase